MQSAQNNNQGVQHRQALPTQNRIVPGSVSQHKSSVLSNPAFGQSFSGSETDVSTSTENLTHEERYVIKHTQRQEPQGEETLTTSSCSRSMDASSCDTLIIHHDNEGGKWFSRNVILHGNEYNPQDYLNRHSQFLYGKQGHGSNSCQYPRMSDNGFLHNNFKKSPSPFSKPQLPDYILKNPHLLCQNNGKSSSIPLHSNIELSGETYSNLEDLYSVHEINGIPEHYLDKSEVLKHLAKEVKGNISDSSNPGSNSQLNQLSSDPDSQESLAMGHSSDISSIGQRLENLSVKPNSPIVNNLSQLPPPPAYPIHKILDRKSQGVNNRSNTEIRDVGLNQPNILDKKNTINNSKSSSNDILSLLNQEHCLLDSGSFNQRDAKIARFEKELVRIKHCQDDLIRSSEKREALERAARSKLQIQVQVLQERNRYLEEQLDQLSNHLNCNLGNTEQQREMGSRDLAISQLMSQNRELLAARERQEVELNAQRATLQEQRTHIDILDSALTNSQANVVKLEEECRKKQMYVERVGQLQRMLTSLQLASERREQMEKSLRQQFEQEIKDLRDKHLDMEPNKEVDELRKQLRVATEKIIHLEGQINKWEQRYLGSTDVNSLKYCSILGSGDDPCNVSVLNTGQDYDPQHLSLMSDHSVGHSPIDDCVAHCAILDKTLVKAIQSKTSVEPIGSISSSNNINLDSSPLRMSAGHSRSNSNIMLDSKLLVSQHVPLSKNGMSSLPNYLGPFNLAEDDFMAPLESRKDKLSDGDSPQSSPSMMSSQEEDRVVFDSEATDNTTNYRKVIDEHLRKLDEEIMAKDKIIKALQKENKSSQEYWEV